MNAIVSTAGLGALGGGEAGAGECGKGTSGTIYGGSVTAMEATEGLQTAAARVIAALPSSPLYARVDGVVTDRGFVVMEVELIEPGLWMDRADGAAGRFADATLAALAGGSGALPDAYAAVEIRADAP